MLAVAGGISRPWPQAVSLEKEKGKIMKRKSAMLAIALATGAVAGTTAVAACRPAQGGTVQLVRICQAVPCQNGQEFEVFDKYGNPVYSVAEFGGTAVYGDNMRVFGPKDIYNPAVVISYTTPQSYAATFPGSNASRCKAPAKWIAPQGTWTCNSSGYWVRVGP